MNRTIIVFAGMFSASSLLLVDSTIKGTAIMVVATIVAMLLKRDSAATRHLVWLLAVVALLIVPVLSATLPEWRVLPQWAGVSPQPLVADTNAPSSIGGPIARGSERPQMVEPVDVEFLSLSPSSPELVDQPASELLDAGPALVTAEITPESTDWSWNWINALPLVWAIGFCTLLLRLLAARLLLWNTERHGTAIWSSQRPEQTTHDPIVMALEASYSQLGIDRPVTLLIHPDKTIPVVWGILRSRLLLPAAARHWSGEQLRSVLMHELAHVKRRDTLSQLLAQIACALHWFNPLVWFAAWRLGVERERACDDLVLASGVRPSAYAEHLLDAVTLNSPARWKHSCGLAMARKSSLEGRLVAVLSQNRNRRGVSVALAALALIIAVGVAVPLAMLRAAEDKWSPPQAAHVITGDFSTYCVHDGKTTAFILAYRGDLNSSSTHDSNAATRTWMSTGTLTAKEPAIAFSFHRTYKTPDKLALTSAPAGTRDLSKPAPAPRKFGQKEFDLTKGRVFLLGDSGEARQLAIEAPVITEAGQAKKLGESIATALPPQERLGAVSSPNQPEGTKPPNAAENLPPGTEEKLQWGEPTNGLRAALVRPQALGEPAAGEIFDFRFVVQNVSEEPIRLSTASVAPTRRYLLLREKGVPLSAMSDAKPTRANFLIQPREVAVLRMFSESPPGNSIAGGPPVMTFSAEFNIENAPEGSWTGKLVAAEMQAATVGYGLLPKNKYAQELFKIWNAGARRNEKIPGALIGLLAESVKQFTDYNPTWKTTPQLLEMLPRFDASRDWTGQEAIALLDELAELQDSPISMAMDRETERTFHAGTPLPPELKDVPWSRVHLSGLRLAWLLEPRAAEHHLNTPLKSRILIYNVSKYAVVFRTDNFHQVAHSATDANGAEIKTESTYWTTLPRFLPYRLAPGEYVELYAPGIGVGANKNYEDWQNTRVGTWIDAKAGDSVTVTTAAIPFYDGIEQPPTDHESGWWLDFIKARLARYEPLPDDAEERKLLLYRVAMELFGTPVSAEITDSFVNDRETAALDSLAKRLHDRPGTTPFTGSLVSGPTTFRVLPVDPDAAKRPRTVHNPGWYTLGEKIVLSITRRPGGERIVNEASIRFYSDDPDKPAPGEPYKVKLPNGYGTWAAAWMRQETMLWVQEKSGFRRIDFSNSVKVKEEVVEPDQVPGDLRAALESILTKAQPAEGASRLPPPAAIRP